jgi:hypothetical protein
MLVRSSPEVYDDVEGRARAISSRFDIMAGMARGWESKSVEEQIEARNSEAQETEKPKLNQKQRELQARKESLMLSRKRTVAMLESARNQGFRELQQKTLEHLDAEIAALE